MRARYVLFASFFCHVSLLLREGIADSGSCADVTLSPLATSEDRFAAKLNLQSESVFQMTAVGELLCMLGVLLVASREMTAVRAEENKPRPLLSVYELVFPLLLTCSLVAVRLRHTGIAGCMPGDSQCCDNMYCPSAHKVQVGNMLEWRGRVSSYKEVPACKSPLHRGPSSDGLGANSIIDWQSRSSYCPAPSWFSKVIIQQCQQLYYFPDTAACFSYGCSSSNTPVQYYSVRLLTGNVILFLVLATVAEV